MIYHGTVELDFILRAPEELAGSMLRDRVTGKTLTSAEAKARAVILKAQGFSVMPCCDNHDKEGNCLGHTDSATERKA